MDFLCYIKIPNDHTETGKAILGFHGNAMDEYSRQWNSDQKIFVSGSVWKMIHLILNMVSLCF